MVLELNCLCYYSFIYTYSVKDYMRKSGVRIKGVVNSGDVHSLYLQCSVE